MLQMWFWDMPSKVRRNKEHVNCDGSGSCRYYMFHEEMHNHPLPQPWVDYRPRDFKTRSSGKEIPRKYDPTDPYCDHWSTALQNADGNGDFQVAYDAFRAQLKFFNKTTDLDNLARFLIIAAKPMKPGKQRKRRLRKALEYCNEALVRLAATP